MVKPYFTRRRRISLKKHLLAQVLFLVGGGGFEPPKALPADLQSVPIGRSGIPPHNIYKFDNTPKMVPRTGIEPVTRGFSVHCSTNWAIEAHCWRPGWGSNSRPPAWQAGVLTNWTTGPNIWCNHWLLFYCTIQIRFCQEFFSKKLKSQE